MIFRGLIFVCVLIVPGVATAATTFTPTRNLSFGTLIPTGTSGTITIGLDSSITTGGAATVAPSGTGYYAGTAVFKGDGLLSSVADVLTMSFLSQTVTLTNDTGGTVTVSNFTHTPNLSISLLNPSTTVSIGAQATFSAASTPGDYKGNIQIRGTGATSGSATATIPIRLTLWRALSVTQTQALNFGGIEMAGGNAVVGIAAANGQRTIVSGTGVRLVSNRPGNAGQFTVTGNPNTAVTITLPSSITLSGPGAAMTVNNFSANPISPATLDANGNMTLRVGARLNVGTKQASGTYRGTYNLTVSY